MSAANYSIGCPCLAGHPLANGAAAGRRKAKPAPHIIFTDCAIGATYSGTDTVSSSSKNAVIVAGRWQFVGHAWFSS